MTKVFFGLIYKKKEKYKEILRKIEKYAPIDIESEEIPFDFTDYYMEEFGSELLRKWISADIIIPENELVDLKHKSIEWEETLSIDSKRTVNCDPGGISETRVVLVTTKNYSHRIYMGDNIFGEVTLVYKNKEFQPLDWTYPDYRSDTFFDFATACRRKLRDIK